MVKKGFTLAETLIVMAIISILFSVAAKVITTKPKEKKQSFSHGYFECYSSGGILYQRTVQDGVETTPKEMGAECVFEPPSGVSFYNINSHDPDHSRFEPNINNTLYISLGGNVSFRNDAGDTYVLASDDLSGMDNTTFFRTLYPESRIYNEGAMHQGVMISW